MKTIHYREVSGRSALFYVFMAFLAALIAAGLAAAHYMESHGHHVTGMTNQIVWGMPHVFAIFLILSASGALNVASLSSVFDRDLYKPLSRLSALLAITLLAGGLATLVLDLGRPDRLIVAMTTYNFRSIFAWNIFLYSGFFVVVAVYLWFMMEQRMNRYVKPAGFLAFFWRLTLTTGTGSIFGFLVAREAYNSAVLAPMFILMSFLFGLAVFLLFLMGSFHWTGRTLGDEVVRRLKNLLGIFIGSVLYLVAVYHLTNIYIAQRNGIEEFILLHGGIYTALFWIGQVLIGGIIPLVLVYHPRLCRSRAMIALAAALVIVGAFAQLYVIIIGGQAYPLILFPGKIVHSSFYDGVINTYTPSLPEITLGLGAVALSIFLASFAVKVLPFLPETLADIPPDKAG
ncbi:MAG: NrfD/PsrC family molybdoenzyme membrane anchor subunit [Acidiferrobacteraceae bacterium]